MTDPTQNALTPDEWNAWQERGELIRHLNYFAACEPPGSGVLLDGPMAGRDAHAAAALCLYQQPFGFTHEDVKLLRDTAALYRSTTLEPKPGASDEDERARLLAEHFVRYLAEPYESLAARIAALLPPESP